MTVSEQLVVKLLRVCSDVLVREHDIGKVGVEVHGMDFYDGIVNALLDEAGAPTAATDKHLRSHLHDVVCNGFMDDCGNPTGASDVELLVAWRTMLAELRMG